MYDGWRGRFYPAELPKRRWFEHYAQQFDAVELNATFYRLPAVTTVEGWARAAPDAFEYAVKLGAFGSHRMKLRDAGSWLPNHLDRVDRLGRSIGPTVVQLPPRWRADPARLDEFLEVARELAPHHAWAVEVRDVSWWSDAVLAVLERHAVPLVWHDLLPDHPLVVIAPWIYLRFHGPDARRQPYCGRYGAAVLRPWADRMRAWRADGIGVRAFFNNDVDGAAPLDAATLGRLLR
jgi:uncharacterized protein YecE (DUF72 family)